MSTILFSTCEPKMPIDV